MRFCAVAMAMACALWSARALAEQEATTAEEALQRAARLMAAGQCEGAIPQLQRAVRLAGLRNALWNMAECYRTLDRPGFATDTYREYLEHEGTQRNRRDQAAARAAIERLRPQVAQVRITSSVENATVRVDGQPIGDAPLTAHLGGGLRNIEVSSPGFETWRQAVQIEPGEDRELEARLDLQPGTLTVSSEPSGAELRVDGQVAGVTPDSVSVPGGGHIIEVSLEGHRTAQRRITVPSGQQITVDVPLTPSQGRLAVAIDVNDATLEVDGEERGTSPFVPLSLSPGQHHIELDAPRHTAWTGEVDILDERTTRVDVELSSTEGINQAGFWTLAVTGAAGLVVGIMALLGAAKDRIAFGNIASTIEAGGDGSSNLSLLQQQGEELADNADMLATLGFASLGVGGAAAISAIVLAFFTRFTRGGSSAEVRVEEAEPEPSRTDGQEVTP